MQSSELRNRKTAAASASAAAATGATAAAAGARPVDAEGQTPRVEASSWQWTGAKLVFLVVVSAYVFMGIRAGAETLRVAVGGEAAVVGVLQLARGRCVHPPPTTRVVVLYSERAVC